MSEKTYVAKVGLTLRDGSRVEEGETTSAAALGSSVSWLLDDGLIVEAPKPKPTPKATTKSDEE